MEPTQIRGMPFQDSLELGSPRSFPITTLAGEFIYDARQAHMRICLLSPAQTAYSGSNLYNMDEEKKFECYIKYSSFVIRVIPV
jgi:hypothetical protein